jgi:HSP20 family protein
MPGSFLSGHLKVGRLRTAVLPQKKEKMMSNTEQKKEALQTTSPFGLVKRVAEDMEHLFDDFQAFRVGSLFGREFFPFTREFEHVDWVPKIDVLRHNGELKIRADLPGMKKDDVKVELTDNSLTLSGERKEEKEEKREGFYRSERSYGSFYRYIPLPEGVKTDTATAEFHDGVLEVKMQAPKTETHGRLLEIKTAEKAEKAKAA